MSAFAPTTSHNMNNLDRNAVSTGCLAKVLSEELRVTPKVLKSSRIPPQVRSLSRLLINTDEYHIPPQVVRVTRGGGLNAGIWRLIANPACLSPSLLPIQFVGVVSAARQERGPALFARVVFASVGTAFRPPGGPAEKAWAFSPISPLQTKAVANSLGAAEKHWFLAGRFERR